MNMTAFIILKQNESMTATETAVTEILKVTGNENASGSVRKAVTEIVQKYYDGKGMVLAKGMAVGLLCDALGVKYGDNAAKIANQLQ